MDRRTAIGGILSAAATKSLGLKVSAADRGADGRAFPFAAQGHEPHKEARRVYCHWHYFPTSIDNKDPSSDYYNREYLSPAGEKGKFQSVGGFLRDRPRGRAPRGAKTWQIEDMQDELRAAAAIGIDAFQFNLSTADLKDRTWQNFQMMLRAEEQAKTRVAAIPCLDCFYSASPNVEVLVSAIVDLASRYNVERDADGRLVLSSYAPEEWSNEIWMKVFEAFESRKIEISYFPVILTPGVNAMYHLQKADLVSQWNRDEFPVSDRRDYFELAVRVLGKRWCAPVWPQDFRPKSSFFKEARNSSLFRRDWQLAMEEQADAALILTWNDYSEHSHIRPSERTGRSFYDLAAYYIHIFKFGNPPDVTDDALYYFHRIEFSAGPQYGRLQAKPFFNAGAGPSTDDIELVAFLTEPGELQIITPSRSTSAPGSAGITIVTAPLELGRPSFRLLRNGRIVIDETGLHEVRGTSEFQDLLYRAGSSWHG